MFSPSGFPGGERWGRSRKLVLLDGSVKLYYGDPDKEKTLSCSETNLKVLATKEKIISR